MRVIKTTMAGSGDEPAYHQFMFGRSIPNQQWFRFEQVLGEQLQQDQAGFRAASLCHNDQNLLIDNWPLQLAELID